jgi:hypothetical protein
MAGCEAEPTPERPAGGACDRQFVAEHGMSLEISLRLLPATYRPLVIVQRTGESDPS